MAHPNIIEDDAELARIVRSANTVAVIGMKDEHDPDAPAFEIPQVAKNHGLRVIPVNPKLESALGEKAYARIGDVPDRVDLVDVFRRSDGIGPHVDEILALPPDRRPPVFWMQTGIRNDAEAERLAREGIKVVQDRCFGVYLSRFRRP